MIMIKIHINIDQILSLLLNALLVCILYNLYLIYDAYNLFYLFRSRFLFFIDFHFHILKFNIVLLYVNFLQNRLNTK
jgi:hypothetical protein